jgi:predicted small lipoprotein YifL
MKKTVLALITLIALTGCGNKLKCTYSDQNEIMKQEKTYYINTKNNVITKIKTIEKFEIFNEKINENYDYVLSLKFEDFKANNIDYKYEHNDNKYNIETTFEINNLDEEKINAYIGTKDLKEFKTNLIDSGYTCK